MGSYPYLKDESFINRKKGDINMWTPLFSFMVFVVFLAIGDSISVLTKSRVS